MGCSVKISIESEPKMFQIYNSVTGDGLKESDLRDIPAMYCRHYQPHED